MQGILAMGTQPDKLFTSVGVKLVSFSHFHAKKTFDIAPFCILLVGTPQIANQ